MTPQALMKHPHTPKLIAGGLTLLLLGSGIGAFATRSSSSPTSSPAASAPASSSAPASPPAPAAQVATPLAQPGELVQPVPLSEGTVQIQGQTYRLVPEGQPVTSPVQPATDTLPVTQVRQNRNSRAPRARTTTQRAYYNYDDAPVARRRGSWWQRNRRDVLTIAAGTGLGAGIGALAGGKKGAGIGALAGGGGTALYTYGLRRRN
ncbi:MAG: hypothetical protein SNJ67_01895 [Chloracidobacterium sp.]|uniref:Glycine zipper domain-containing protein n=1 Tax=Chloracidobacterium validum TaxID=2821543 RepID=A0ABX8B848_9BACT|nr:hypothetical protein [Chloracidobacterium validum]QUW03078.1 hypothetical protein J8C06_01135 [Chloracidobacterium validum]